MSEPIHILYPSAPRRAFGLVVQIVLGLALLYLAVAHPPQVLGWRIFLVVLGIAALVLGHRGWVGSAQGIVLDETGLREESGRVIAPLDRIVSVDRALFSFKPSNGFLIRLDEPLGRAWVPGMWWRIGRRVGIGGVTRGAETKILSDALSMMIAQRDRA
ncbi:hypothetical protein [Jannaschia seohaensis]|uniref:PH (Pleckstrin Homology) domain-containing protein n=1 Tax=Jannaschia seohaensis TaxID=475081 RepID=A0A2Y9A2Y2_9RHOB|nr:hypothetical protein [Jannaschia seohaensis]PWJ22506.1 hypothetical protein BCF38_101920 [Jannaschia seohaensis]SSA38784.1 hypothetical protein SAMN05421539_101920 [Jannaschia seohaensis]